MDYFDLPLVLELDLEQMGRVVGGTHIHKNFGGFVVARAHLNPSDSADEPGVARDSGVQALLQTLGLTFGESLSSDLIHMRMSHNNPGKGVGPWPEFSS
jgi:hypothetical protein